MTNKNSRLFNIYLMLISALLLNGTTPARSSSDALILKHADYNRNTMKGGQLVSYLKGNVVFKYKEYEIFCRNSTWHRSTGDALFRDSVHIHMGNESLNCNRMSFSKDKKLLTATGNIYYVDNSDNIIIEAQKAFYHTDTENIELENKPKLMKIDTTEKDTIIIIGNRMNYNDKDNLASVFQNVHIFKGMMHSTCSKAYFHPDIEMTELRINPEIEYDTDSLKGDSINIYFKDNSLRGISVMSGANALHKNPSKNDTVITRINGDSLYMKIANSGTIDTIWSSGNVTCRYYDKKNPARQDEASGKTMIMNFNKDGEAQRLVIKENAKMFYYTDDGSERGTNSASGDEMLVYFKNNKASYFSLSGGARGIYISEM